MTLYEQIKDDLKEAIKAKSESKNILRVLIGELDTLSKSEKHQGPITDPEVISAVKKLMESNKMVGSTEAIAENLVIEKYFPSELPLDELTKMVEDFISKENLSGMKSMGRVMGYFSKNYAGQYDGKILSDIVKSNLL